MKNLFLILFIILVKFTFAQPLSFHILGGVANYSGDLQQKKFTLAQSNAVVTVGGTINITDKMAIRGDYLFTHLGADDKKSSNPLLIARNLNFKTVIHELTLTGEYDLFNFNDRFTPYIFGGIGLFHFNPYTYDSKNVKVFLFGLSTEGEGLPARKPYTLTQLNVPLGGGVKYNLSHDISLGFEIGVRVLKTDYVDDVSKTYVAENTLVAFSGQQAADLAFRGDELKINPHPYPSGGTPRGNPEVNDLYYYSQVRLSFRMPWFDNGRNGAYKSGRQKLDCPLIF